MGVSEMPGMRKLVLENTITERSRENRSKSIMHGMRITERSKMTNREKAIVMAYTGVCLLAGEELAAYYQYVKEITGRSVCTHEFADSKTMIEIKKNSRRDFMMLCRRQEADNRMEGKAPVFMERESIVAVDYENGTGEMKKQKYADWTCPVCGWFVGERYIPRMHSQQKSDYCSRCGQAIDWSKISKEELEESRKRMEKFKTERGVL